MYSKSLASQDVRLMGRRDSTSLGYFPDFSTGMIVATLYIGGQWVSEKDELNIDSISWRVTGPSDLKNKGEMLSGPAAPLYFMFLMADSNSPN